MPNRTLDHRQLDQEYKNSLSHLKERILTIRDLNEIKICAEWIQRFNRARSSEKFHRNKLIHILIAQLADDNLSYPFIFRNNLGKSLTLVGQEVQQLLSSGEETNDELRDILSNMKHLLDDAETMNMQVEEDLESIRSEPLKCPIRESRSLEYNLFLCEELRRLLTDEIPRLVNVPNRKVVCNDGLKQVDLAWIQQSIAAISSAVETKFTALSERTTKAVQTRTDWKFGSLEAYYEQKFAKLYMDSLLKDRALQIKLKSKEGLHQIEQTRTLEQRVRRKVEKRFL